MVFQAPVKAPVSAPFATAGAAAAPVPWWNPDGVTPAANTGAWLAKGASSQAASYLNLGLLGNADIDPVVVGGVAPAWAGPTGWTYTGTENLRTGIIPTINHTLIARFTGVTATGNHAMAGCYTNGNARIMITPSITAALRGYYHASSAEYVGGLVVAGNLAVTKNGGYLNGVLDTAPFAPVWVGCTTAIWIGGLNWAGVLQWGFKGTVVAIADYDTTLTVGQIAARVVAMAAL